MSIYFKRLLSWAIIGPSNVLFEDKIVLAYLIGDMSLMTKIITYMLLAHKRNYQ